MTKQFADSLSSSHLRKRIQDYAPPLHFFHSGGHVARFHLADFLPSDAPRPTVICFEAPGGYGKTRAAFDLFNDFDGLKFWLGVAGWDSSDAYALALNLICAVDSIEKKNTQTPQTQSERFTELTRTGGVAVDAALGMALEACLQNAQAPVCFVIDDAHLLLNDPSLNQILRAFARALPASSLLLFTSRRQINAPGLAVTRVDESQLRFSPADAQKALLRHGISPQKQTLHLLVEQYQGHPLSCCLAGLNLADGASAQIQTFEQDGIAPGQSLSSKAAAHQVLHALHKETPDTQRLLRASALLHTFNAQDCDALLGRNDSAAVLGSFRNSVLLIHHADGTWRHAHDLIRETLLQALQDTATPQDVSELRLRAGHIYAARGFTQEALAHFAAGGHCPAACALVEAQIWEWLDESDALALQRHLDALPVEWVEGEPMLLIAKASHGYMTMQEGFLELLQKAQHIARQRGDEKSFVWASIERVMQLTSEERMFEAQAEMPEMTDEELARLPIRLQAQFWLVRGNMYRGVEKHQAALIDIQRAMDILQDAGATQSYLRAWRYKNWGYNTSGRNKQAIASARDLVATSQLKRMGPLSLAWNTYQLLWFLIDAGHWRETRPLLGEVDALLQRALPADKPYNLREFMLRRHMDYCRMTGDDDGAERFGRMLQEYESASVWSFWTEPYFGLLQASRGARDVQNFRALADKIWQEFPSRRDAHSPANATAYIVFRVASWLMDKPTRHELTLAEAELMRIRATLTSMDLRYELACVNAWLAFAHLLQKYETRAGQYLHDTLNYLAGEETVYLHLLSPRVAAELWAFAIAQNILGDVAETLAKHPFVRERMEPFVKLLGSPDAQTRECAQRVLAHQRGGACDPASLLAECKPALRPLFEQWLTSGWLTADGLAGLRAHLTWKQTQVFLAWLSPQAEGSIKQAGVLCKISLDNARVHLTTTKRILRERAHAPASPSTHNEFLRWAQELSWVKTYIAM